MSTSTPFTLLPGADDVACGDGVCAVPAASDVVTDVAAEPAES